MAIFDFSKTTENHYHGEAPDLVVNGDSGDVSDNAINVSATGTSTAFEIFKIVLTQVFAILGGITIAYAIYLFGFSGKPIEIECYLPIEEQAKSEYDVPKEKTNPLPTPSGSK